MKALKILTKILKAPVTLKIMKIEEKCLDFIVLQPCVPGNKLTQKDNADTGVKFISPMGPRQTLLLAKDPEPYIPYMESLIYPKSTCSNPPLQIPRNCSEQRKRKIQSKLTRESYTLSLGS